MTAEEKVIVLDFGGQYNQLVARRVRECNVYCEIYSYRTPIEQIKAMAPNSIFLFINMMRKEKKEFGQSGCHPSWNMRSRVFLQGRKAFWTSLTDQETQGSGCGGSLD